MLILGGLKTQKEPGWPPFHLEGECVPQGEAKCYRRWLVLYF